MQKPSENRQANRPSLLINFRKLRIEGLHNVSYRPKGYEHGAAMHGNFLNVIVRARWIDFINNHTALM